LDAALLQKANKQSVANALQRKANKNDLAAIEQKLAENGFSTIDDRVEEFKAIVERQKESYVDLLQNEIMILKNETEASLKKSLSKELLKINSEIQSVHDSFERFCSSIKGN
jgi:molecular chaperone GrpE (heat shock protein)